MKETICAIAILIGVILIYTSLPVGLGYALYLWAHSTAVSMAAWLGFVTFIKMLIGGWVLAIVGAVTGTS